ncbi:MAG: hypothetical protein WC562_03170 [Dehalococcoidia bacterium]
MKRLLIPILLMAVIISGCSNGSTSQLTPTPTPTLTSNPVAQEIISKSVSAMANISLCHMSICVKYVDGLLLCHNMGDVNDSTVILLNSTEITGSSGTKEITVNESYPSGFIATVFNLTAANGEWSATQSEGDWQIDGSPVITLNGSYDRWVPSDQYPQAIHLIENGTQVIFLADETIDDIECYTINMVPSKEDLINWVYSQEQPQPFGDLHVTWFHTDTIARQKDIYNISCTGSPLTVWIDKSTYQVVRVNISATFEVLPEHLTLADFGGGIGGGNEQQNMSAACTESTCEFCKIYRYFYSQMDFSTNQ